MNKQKAKTLKGLIKIRTDLNINEFADRVNISRSAFSNKLNDKVDFKLKEIQAISKELNLTNEEFVELFKE